MSLSSALRALVLERDKFRCMFCGATAQQIRLQVDHIIPRDEGGTDSLDNLATLCQKCNRGKSNKYFGNYRQMILSGQLSSPQRRSNVYPTLDYQLNALRQVITQISNHQEVPLSNFVRAIEISALRKNINPSYEPLTFATVKEGVDELIHTGELAIENGTVTFPLSNSFSAHESDSMRQRLLYAYAEAQGWDYVSFENQHGLSFALSGQQLGPEDVAACPQLPEVTTVLRQVTLTSRAIIIGKSGSGKTITAFQAAYRMHQQGWEVLCLGDHHRSVEELVDGISCLPQRTVLILDNAHSLDQRFVRRLLGRTTENLAVIIISTEEDNSMRDAISIARVRAVDTLTQGTLNRKKEILPIIQKLDPRVGEGFFDIPFERRVQEAAQSETPWQFHFVLTGGERRANDILATLRESKRADLLLAVIAAGQIVTLDEGMSKSWLERALHLLKRDHNWLEESLQILQQHRVVFGETYYRCSHLRFALYTLQNTCAKNNDPEWNNFVTMLAAILTWESTPLRGISWLLNEMRFYDVFAYQQKDNGVISTPNWQQIFERCWKATSDQERRDATFVLEALIDWYPPHRQAIFEKTSLLVQWIEQAEGDASFGLGTLLNSLGQGREDAKQMTEMMCEQIDPHAIATRLSQVKWAEVIGWSHLIGRLRWTSSKKWREQFDQIADFTFLEALVDSMSIGDVYAFSELLKNISGYHPEKFLGIYEKAIPTLVEAIHSNVLEAFSESRDGIWFILGFVSGFLRRRAPLASQRRVAKKLVNSLQPQIIAQAISHAPQRDWGTCAELVSFMKEASPRQATKVLELIDFAQLDQAAQGLWKRCPHELLQLLLALSILPDQEPARSWFMRHADELDELNTVIAYITPHIAVEKLRAGYFLPLTIFYTELTIVALQAIATIDPSLAVSVIESNRSKIAEGLSELQPHNCRRMETLLACLHSLSASVFTAIINEVDPEKATKNWSQCLQGNTESKKVIGKLFALSQLAEGPIVEVIHQLRIKYPVASLHHNIKAKQPLKIS